MKGRISKNLPFVFIAATMGLTSFTQAAGTLEPCPQNEILKIPTSTLTVVEHLCTQECDLLESAGRKNKLKGTLSPLWAQEYIGADLAKEALSEIKKAETVSLGVIDVFQNSSHGKKCRSLATGTTPFSVSEMGIPFEYDTTGVNRHEDAVRQILESPKKDKNFRIPKIINDSMTWGNGTAIPQAFKKLSQTILVTGSGNSFPTAVEKEKKQFENLILVGSASPYGLPSEFSQEDEKVTISAPTDYYVESEYGQFDGTSGATALVSGALVNVISLLPNLTPSEAHTLLRKTALPSIQAFEKKQRNGAGLLNAYKLLEVAKRIQSQCRDASDFQLCQKAKIEDPKTYDFRDARAPNVLEKLEQYFPECGANSASPASALTCQSCEKKNYLKALRRQALLNPEVKANWQALACIHSKKGLTTNAAFYSHMMGGNEHLEVIMASLKSTNSSQRESAVRGVLSLGAEGIPILKKFTQNSDPVIHAAAIKALSTLGEESFSFVENAIKDKELLVRTAAAMSADRLGSKVLVILEQALRDKDSPVRQAAVKTAGRLGPQGLPLLETAVKDSSLLVREAVAEAAAKLGKMGTPILLILTQDSDPTLRFFASKTLEDLKESP